MHKAYEDVYKTAKNGWSRYYQWDRLPQHLKDKIGDGGGIYDDGLFTHTRGPDGKVVFLNRNKNLNPEVVESFEKRYADT